MNSHCCHRANEVGVWATKNQNNSSVISLLVMQEGQSQVPLNQGNHFWGWTYKGVYLEILHPGTFAQELNHLLYVELNKFTKCVSYLLVLRITLDFNKHIEDSHLPQQIYFKCINFSLIKPAEMYCSIKAAYTALMLHTHTM